MALELLVFEYLSVIFSEKVCLKFLMNLDLSPNWDLLHPDSEERYRQLAESIKFQIDELEKELNSLNSNQKIPEISKPASPENKPEKGGTFQLRQLQTYSAAAMSKGLNGFTPLPEILPSFPALNDNDDSVTENLADTVDSNKSFRASKTARNFKNNYLENYNIMVYWESVLSFAKKGQIDEAFYALVRVIQRLLDEKAIKRSLGEKASKSYVDNLYERVSGSVKENLKQTMEDSTDNLENQVLLISRKIGELKQFFQKELRDVTNQIADLQNDESDYKNETYGLFDTLPKTSSGKSSSRSRTFSVYPNKT